MTTLVLSFLNGPSVDVLPDPDPKLDTTSTDKTVYETIDYK